MVEVLEAVAMGWEARDRLHIIMAVPMVMLPVVPVPQETIIRHQVEQGALTEMTVAVKLVLMVLVLPVVEVLVQDGLVVVEVQVDIEIVIIMNHQVVEVLLKPNALYLLGDTP